MAAFHPDLRDAPGTDAASLVPFIRRTPDPTLQLVRTSLLDHLARGGRDLSAEIAAANFATVALARPGRPRQRAARHPPRPRRQLRAPARELMVGDGLSARQGVPTLIRPTGRICASGESSWYESTARFGCSVSMRRRT